MLLKKAPKMNLEQFIKYRSIQQHGNGYWKSMKTQILQYYKEQIKQFKYTKQQPKQLKLL